MLIFLGTKQNGQDASKNGSTAFKPQSQLPAQPHDTQNSLPRQYPIPPYAAGFSNSTKRPENPSSKLPHPPSISDEAIKKAVFTHQGMLGAKHSIDHALSYERLEFLGDAYIEVIASRLLWDRFPKLSPGRLSMLRELLVKNETLCEYALGYGFDRRLSAPESHMDGQSKLFVKTMGDIMEAYVAGVILSDPKDGFQRVEAWLTELWAPKLENKNVEFKSDKLSKQKLQQTLGGKYTKIEYLDEGEREEVEKGLFRYYISVFFTGWGWTKQYLGTGEGFNKTEAGNQAAARALANRPLIDDIARKKQAYDAESKAKKEMEKEGDDK
jgi:ribonuclease-3